jgi:hypothetical protein
MDGGNVWKRRSRGNKDPTGAVIRALALDDLFGLGVEEMDFLHVELHGQLLPSMVVMFPGDAGDESARSRLEIDD